MVQSRGGISLANRYRLLAELVHGPTGTVWRARDEHLERDVAIKELRLPANVSEADKPAFLHRLPREARAAAQLGHPSIIDVYDVVIEHGHPWLVMESAEGQTLEQRVAQRGPLPPAQVADIASRLLDALHAAHDAGILHRDIKPGNVLLTEDGRVLLTDFALPGTGHSQTFAGPAAYVPPEVARGDAPTPKSDLWCLGATLFAAVEGHSPYDRENTAATPGALRAAEPQRAGRLTALIMGLLEESPGRRLSHARAVDRLERAVAAPRPNRREADRRRLLVAVSLAAATCVVGVIGLGGLTLGMMREQPAQRTQGGPSPAVGGAGSAAPEGVESNPLVIRAVGDQCKVFVARPGNTEVVFDGVLTKGQVGQYDFAMLDAVVQDAAACDVWINGRHEPPGRPGERKKYTVRDR